MLLCLVLSQLIKSNRQRILQTVEGLVQEAEEAIQGSGMGAETKAYVIDRLEGIKCGRKPTSCPDQLARGLRSILAQENAAE